MSDYAAPLQDMRFVLNHVVGLDRVTALPDFADAAEVADAVLEEAGKLAAGVIAPLNRPGDLNGARLDNGEVRTAPGWKEAYARFAEGGGARGLVTGREAVFGERTRPGPAKQNTRL